MEEGGWEREKGQRMIHVLGKGRSGKIRAVKNKLR